MVSEKSGNTGFGFPDLERKSQGTLPWVKGIPTSCLKIKSGQNRGILCSDWHKLLKDFQMYIEPLHKKTPENIM